VAATALTVKSALSGTLAPATQPPLDEIEKNLNSVKEAAVLKTQTAVAEAQAGLPSSMLGGERGAVPRTAPSEASQRVSDGLERAYRTNSRSRIVNILKDAAARHGVDAKLVLAVSFWESGWDQSKVSETGAIGLMQVEPDTARSAGTSLLGRTVNINDAYDNADVGVAVLREDLDNFKTPEMALAAYYQGPTSLEQNGMLPDTQQYVEGILDLESRMPS
jgi:soluble lytic murein transglycosylase-like protein